MPEQTPPKKIVLAYSGGLDTSVILPWLKERYPGVKLVAFAAELGQGDELEDRRYELTDNADECRHGPPAGICRNIANSPCSAQPSIYEQDYLLNIAQPLIAAKRVEVAQQLTPMRWATPPPAETGAIGRWAGYAHNDLKIIAFPGKIKI